MPLVQMMQILGAIAGCIWVKNPNFKVYILALVPESAGSDIKSCFCVCIIIS